MTREESGFFTRLALGLPLAGVGSLRFDLRAHGASEGRQEDLTLAGIVNDIRAAVDHLAPTTGISALSLVGTSFKGSAPFSPPSTPTGWNVWSCSTRC